MDTLKSIESIKWIQFKMKMDGHFFLYVVESWPINEQASDRLLFFLSTAFDAGIINHLFILSIKYDKYYRSAILWESHHTFVWEVIKPLHIFIIFIESASFHSNDKILQIDLYFFFSENLQSSFKSSYKPNTFGWIKKV